MQILHSPLRTNLCRAGVEILGTELYGGNLEVAWLRTFVTVISPLFLIPNTSAILPGMDILGTGQERSSHGNQLPGWERRTCS